MKGFLEIGQYKLLNVQEGKLRGMEGCPGVRLIGHIQPRSQISRLTIQYFCAHLLFINCKEQVSKISFPVLQKVNPRVNGGIGI